MSTFFPGRGRTSLPTRLLWRAGSSKGESVWEPEGARTSRDAAGRFSEVPRIECTQRRRIKETTVIPTALFGLKKSPQRAGGIGVTPGAAAARARSAIFRVFCFHFLTNSRGSCCLKINYRLSVIYNYGLCLTISKFSLSNLSFWPLRSPAPAPACAARAGRTAICSR